MQSQSRIPSECGHQLYYTEHQNSRTIHGSIPATHRPLASSWYMRTSLSQSNLSNMGNTETRKTKRTQIRYGPQSTKQDYQGRTATSYQPRIDEGNGSKSKIRV